MMKKARKEMKKVKKRREVKILRWIDRMRRRPRLFLHRGSGTLWCGFPVTLSSDFDLAGACRLTMVGFRGEAVHVIS